MTAVAVKICGVTAADAVEAAVAGGAAFIGFNFYPPSPRALTPAAAGSLARAVPAAVSKVGVFVDADDASLAATLAEVPLDMLQLHGAETPARVAAVRARFGRPVIKAVAVGSADDLARAETFVEVADWLLFDARPPADKADALPGGNALAFDWRLLAGRTWPRPWLLSGGLDPTNVAAAVRISGARAVDVSSGVEDRRGHKSPALIAAFMAAVRGLEAA